jgi:subtilisin family serine protease
VPDVITVGASTSEGTHAAYSDFGPATRDTVERYQSYHEQTFGEDALFAYAEWSDLDASHKRQEIETDLLGAYYLEVREAPLAQFGHTENVPP